MDVVEVIRVFSLTGVGAVRFHTVGEQHLARRFAPDDATFAEAALGPARAVQITPDFSGDTLHFGITVWIVFQTGGLFRRGADDSGAVANQLPKFLDDLDRHGLRRYRRNPQALIIADSRGYFRHGGNAILQHQQPVTHAVRQHNPAVFDRHPFEEHFGIAVIAVVAGAKSGNDIFGRSHARRLFA